MSNTSISLKPINDLLGEQYFIADYQRGYRWGEQQVTELLEDVLSFQSGLGSGSNSGFYCLQPIVVKEIGQNGQWEVVDGQQRLTTVYLILQFFNERLAEKFRRQLYTIDYETRPGSKHYLAEPTEERSGEFIDYHFVYRAMKTIHGWFSDKDHLVNDFEAALLNRVKVIWYQLPATENPIDAFTRLNVGKIPLTNSELVRALFLRSKNFPQVSANKDQMRIAQEWDLIEKTLQNDDFWYFLTEDAELTNRIELLFDLIAEANPGTKTYRDDPLRSFHRFNELMTDEGKKPEQMWDDVKQCFMTLQEWYSEAQLFHLVGFLINEGEDLLDLIRLSAESGKAAFRSELKKKVLKSLLPAIEDQPLTEVDLTALLDAFVDELEYGSHSSKIKSVLLLFNIASIIANDRSIVRFRFDYFKNESWDIEHIRSVKSGRPIAYIDKSSWLEALIQYFDETGKNKQLGEEAAEMLSTRSYTTGDTFDEFYDRVIEHFGEHESSEAEHGIGNLALLDSGSNRGYSNAVFPIKRRKLLQYDQEGTFVPLCTRNAFLKCYSDSVENMFFWGAEDQNDYRKAIVETLVKFFMTNGEDDV